MRHDEAHEAHDMHNRVCYSCEALRGERHISPGQRIFEGKWWVVEHAWPASVVGWVVLVLRRHAAALHELAADEFAEMGTLLARVILALHAETGCAKEYLACFAEAEHFQHVHIHVVPRATGLPQALQGPRIFTLLDPEDGSRAALADVQAFCGRLAAAMDAD
jgi:diadenosine tetraphosphate (Ap4A) HIT family hydrolase